MSRPSALQIEPAVVADVPERAILCAPPFPGSRPRGGPRRRSFGSALVRSPREILEICNAVAESRVGGAFWAKPPELPRVSVLVRAQPELRSPLLSGIMRREHGRSILVSFPGGKPRPRAASTIGVRHLAGDHDVWSLISLTDRIIASPNDELSLLAAASGRQVHDPATGVSIDIEDARNRFLQAIDAYEYADPFDGKEIDVIGWISILERWRAEIDSNRSIARLVGVRRWKSGALQQLLWSDQRPKLTSSSEVRGTPIGKSIALWPSRAPPGLLQKAAAAGVDITRVEDGFIRSVGLGTLLVPPCSIVVDRLGIYYDPTQPSDLEQILSDTEFSAALLRRADALIGALVQGGVTKYAAGTADAVVLPTAARRILVPGQVEDDQSVRLGAAGVSGNLDLLRRTRLAEPDAWIAYRPHPDVASGLRKGHVAEEEALHYADAVIGTGAMSDLLDQVDGVHVLTSLAGFEALLRGREVYTHGQPFYASWGLTRDLGVPIARRQRRLTLLELVAGTLILYPRYLDPLTRLPCPPEVLVQRHTAAPRSRPTLLNQLRSYQGKAQLLGRHLAGAFG